MTRFQVMGVGRVGSYAAAKRAHRSRNHRYWAIAKRDESCSANCKCAQTGIHYPKGWVEDKSHPKFKTRKEATKYLEEYHGQSDS